MYHDQERIYSEKYITINKCVEKQSWISLNPLDVQGALSWFQRAVHCHDSNER